MSICSDRSWFAESAVWRHQALDHQDRPRKLTIHMYLLLWYSCLFAAIVLGLLRVPYEDIKLWIIKIVLNAVIFMPVFSDRSWSAESAVWGHQALDHQDWRGEPSPADGGTADQVHAGTGPDEPDRRAQGPVQRHGGGRAVCCSGKGYLCFVPAGCQGVFWAPKSSKITL